MKEKTIGLENDPPTLVNNMRELFTVQDVETDIKNLGFKKAKDLVHFQLEYLKLRVRLLASHIMKIFNKKNL